MKLLHFTAILLAFLILSCQQDPQIQTTIEDLTGINSEVKQKIINLGFNPENSFKTPGGYIVEGDIFLTEEDLVSLPNLRIPVLEQYRTTNLVTVPNTNTKTISISLNKEVSSLAPALDEAIARYNAENLKLRFQRVSKNGNIKISKAASSAGYLASAGFPYKGRPYSNISVNLPLLGSQPFGTIVTVLAHEMGHCIGFRHTDYYNRSISCGGTAYSEGATSAGAIHIPGTPEEAVFSDQSWMLSCIGSGHDRPFNVDDKIALDYLY